MPSNFSTAIQQRIKCAGEQGKFWDMYVQLFNNQRNLSDNDFLKYASQIKLNEGKFKKCVANPGAIEDSIAQNIQSGAKLGVTGTPAFFINGRRLSGALPFEEFKRIINEEMAKIKTSKKKS